MAQTKPKINTIEFIQGQRKSKGKWEYYTKWLGWEERHNTWEPEKNLGSAGAAHLANWRWVKQQLSVANPIGTNELKLDHNDVREALTVKNAITPQKSSIKKARPGNLRPNNRSRKVNSVRFDPSSSSKSQPSTSASSSASERASLTSALTGPLRALLDGVKEEIVAKQKQQRNLEAIIRIVNQQR